MSSSVRRSMLLSWMVMCLFMCAWRGMYVYVCELLADVAIIRSFTMLLAYTHIRRETKCHPTIRGSPARGGFLFAQYSSGILGLPCPGRAKAARYLHLSAAVILARESEALGSTEGSVTATLSFSLGFGIRWYWSGEFEAHSGRSSGTVVWDEFLGAYLFPWGEARRSHSAGLKAPDRPRGEVPDGVARMAGSEHEWN